MKNTFDTENTTSTHISREFSLRSKLQCQKELIRLASKDVLAKERKIEALKIENLRLKRLVKSQSEGVGA
jgi:hypothetical protein